MHQAVDPRGHALWTASEAAARACNAGVEGYTEFRADTMEYLDAAIAADADFALPKLVKAWVLHAARDWKHATTIERLADDAERCVDPCDDRAVDYLASLRFAGEGRGVESATTLEGLLDRHPTDLLAHRVLQFELFWNGRADWMCDIAERAASHWDGTIPGYATYLSCRAFSNEEVGRYEAAERYARTAVELDAANVWGAHAFAHVALMQGRFDVCQVLVDACRRLGHSDLAAIFVRDAYRIGFDRVESRSFYCDAMAPAQSAQGLPA